MFEVGCLPFAWATHTTPFSWQHEGFYLDPKEDGDEIWDHYSFDI